MGSKQQRGKQHNGISGKTEVFHVLTSALQQVCSGLATSVCTCPTMYLCSLADDTWVYYDYVGNYGYA